MYLRLEMIYPARLGAARYINRALSFGPQLADQPKELLTDTPRERSILEPFQFSGHTTPQGPKIKMLR